MGILRFVIVISGPALPLSSTGLQSSNLALQSDPCSLIMLVDETPLWVLMSFIVAARHHSHYPFCISGVRGPRAKPHGVCQPCTMVATALTFDPRPPAWYNRTEPNVVYFSARSSRQLTDSRQQYQVLFALQIMCQLRYDLFRPPQEFPRAVGADAPPPNL